MNCDLQLKDNASEIGPNLRRHTLVYSSFEEFLFNSSPAHMFSLLSKLCKSKATGLDDILAKLLRECADLLAEHLTAIFNQSP